MPRIGQDRDAEDFPFFQNSLIAFPRKLPGRLRNRSVNRGAACRSLRTPVNLAPFPPRDGFNQAVQGIVPGAAKIVIRPISGLPEAVSQRRQKRSFPFPKSCIILLNLKQLDGEWQ